MRLLLDENLSPRLAVELARVFPGSMHVRDLGLASADDESIWQRAKEQGFAILSKDADFHQMSFLRGHPPKVLWMRLGNATTDEIHAAVLRHLDSIALFEENEDAAFLALA